MVTEHIAWRRSLRRPIAEAQTAPTVDAKPRGKSLDDGTTSETQPLFRKLRRASPAAKSAAPSNSPPEPVAPQNARSPDPFPRLFE